MKRILLLAAFALVASPAWAYGAYRHIDTAGMVLETARPFFTILLMSLLPYLVCSIWMERTRGFEKVIPLFLDLCVTVLWVMPNLATSGEYGPVHVALSVAGPSCIVFPALLACKFAVLSLRNRAPEVPMAVIAPAK